MDEQTTPTTPAGGEKNKVMLYATIAVVLLLALGAAYLFMTGSALTDLTGTMTEDDEAVAVVNGEEISRRAYNNATAQLANIASTQGATLTEAQMREQTLNSLINNRLLVQEAHANGHTASDAQVQTEYDLVVENAGGVEAFNTQLQSLGISEDEVKTELAEQLAVNSFLLATVSGTASTTITDEEVNAFYESIAVADGEIPPLADIRAQIEEQIRIQKQQQEVAAILEALRAEASVEILI